MSDGVHDATILAYARAAAEDGELIDSLKRQIETFEEVNADLVRRNNEHWTVRTQQAADLAQCRAQLSALVAASAAYERALAAIDMASEECLSMDAYNARVATLHQATEALHAAQRAAPEGGQAGG